MKYITKDEIRNLTGLTEVEVNDSQLERIIDDAENLVDTYTDKSWSSSDSKYSKIQTATRFLAASLVYESLPKTPENEGKAQLHYPYDFYVY